MLKTFIDYFKRQPIVKRAILGAGIIVVSAFAFFLVLFGMVWSGVLGHIPNKKELKLAQNPSSSEIYSADSVLLGRYFIQERSNITYDQLPAHIVDAVIAAEDVRFYTHHGIDKKSLVRVMVKSIIFQMDGSGGGSTITQQLAKNLFPREKYAMLSLFINKVREMIIATRLEEVYNKNEILTLYLNTVPFGENIYGLETAAELFFSCHAWELSVLQGATLTGMLKANHTFNPRLYPDRSRERRNVVLSQMMKYNMLEEAIADSLKALPLILRYNKITHHQGLAAYFREYLRPELSAWCERYNELYDTNINLYTAGLKIYTTIDSRMQQYAEEAMAQQMASIQNAFNQQNNTVVWNRHPEMVDQAIKKSDHYTRLIKNGMSTDDAMKVMLTPVPMDIFTWEGEHEVIMSPVDSIKHYLKFLNAGMLAVDPENGAVKVWVGGINHKYFQFDHVRASTKRQVGSTFKPIVYASALESGERPCAFISAEKITYTNMEDWAPENGHENYNLKYSMPGALAYSVNTVSVRVLEKAGINRTVKLAHQMGITSELESVPSLALGSANISMIEMVTAYTAFVRAGSIAKPFYIMRISDHANNTLEEFHSLKPVQVMSSETAQMILYMLRRSVNEGGTSSGLRARYNLHNDIAGKTGTTQSNVDGWFIGITPKLVIGAWVGADDPRIRSRSSVLGQGARTALPIVANFLQRANQDKKMNLFTTAHFPELSESLSRKLDCVYFKEDRNIIKTLFSRKDKEKKRKFSNTPRQGFFKRLFGKKVS